MMYVMISPMVSMSSSYCRVLNRFVKASWYSNFFDPICVASWWPLRHHLFPFHVVYVQFDVARNQPVATSNVDLVDDCYVCDDV